MDEEFDANRIIIELNKYFTNDKDIIKYLLNRWEYHTGFSEEKIIEELERIFNP